MRRWRSAATALVAAVAACVAGCAAPAGSTGVAVRAHSAQEAGAAPSAPSAPSGTPGPSGPGTATPSVSASLSPSPSPKALGPGEGSLTVLAPRGYAEYGGYDPAVNWVKGFESESGCKVNLRYPPAPAEMDAMARRVPYDAIAAPPDVAGRLVAERRAAPINTSLLTHYDDIPEWLRELRPAAPGDGAEHEVYGVPYLWGWYATLTTGDVRGLDAASLYKEPGAVTLPDGPLSIADAALALRLTRPSLGVGDPFALTPDQLDAAVALLAERRAEHTYWEELIEPLQGLAGGAARLARTVPYQQDLLRRAGRKVRAVQDGETTGWVDNWMLAARPASPNCAYRWLDWIGGKDAQRQAAEWTGLAPANEKACTGRAARVCYAYRMTDTGWLKKVRFAVRPSRACGEDGGCTDYTEWVTRWRDLVAG